MSELTPDVKENIRRQYCREHGLARLNRWPTRDEKNPTALLFLQSQKRVREVLDASEGPLLQAVENAERFDKGFNRLPDGTVDVIIGRIVGEKAIGTLGVDTLGKPLFKPQGHAT